MTTSPADLLALAAEIEALTEPSREMDARVLVAVHEGLTVVSTWWGDSCIKGPDESTNPAPLLTASLDAAMALKDELLPGWDWYLARDGEIIACSVEEPDRIEQEIAHAALAPCAFLAAVLRAVASIELA
jgi:hypothetical protein